MSYYWVTDYSDHFQSIAEQGALAIPARVIATCFALVGFAAACVIGLASGNPTTTVLLRAMLVMAGAWLIGRLIGGFLQTTVEDHLVKYKAKHPIVDETQFDRSQPASDDQDDRAEPAAAPRKRVAA